MLEKSPSLGPVTKTFEGTARASQKKNRLQKQILPLGTLLTFWLVDYIQTSKGLLTRIYLLKMKFYSLHHSRRRDLRTRPQDCRGAAVRAADMLREQRYGVSRIYFAIEIYS